MQLSGAFPITFAGGRTDYVLKYVCNTCRVEMNRMEKTPLRHSGESGRVSAIAPPKRTQRTQA